MIACDPSGHVVFDGAVLSSSTLALATYPYRRGKPRAVSGSRIFLFAAGKWMASNVVPVEAVGMVPLDPDGRRSMLLGRDGDVAILDSDVLTFERLPGAVGPMRGLRWVGTDIVAFGMNRDIFRRTTKGWVRDTQGIPSPINSTLPLEQKIRVGLANAGGITAIAETAAGRRCAVGFRGEIYERSNESWALAASPTNLTIHDVTAFGERLVACGQRATILSSTSLGIWELLEPDGPKSVDFLSIVEFAGNTYLADGSAIWMMQGDSLALVPTGPSGDAAPAHRLVAGHGQLLSLSGAEVHRTRDGRTWEKILG